ncbi:MAG: lytic transglycosylase domain-containing protein [Maritimibacter sp.]|nr:lytic transglycosylase domain-containing protein [Maritimibacter sp.]
MRSKPGTALRALSFAAGIAILCALGPTPLRAETDLSAVCERAAVEAAAHSGVPVSVLKAISLTETGRARGGDVRPWPWTVNMEGKGVWFDTREAALAYVYEHYKRGARSFDVGCFQINYKWHHENFASIEEMFDPSANAAYAAAFLTSLQAESGDWETAAGAFHSRTPEYADRYKAKFAEYRARFVHEDGRPLVVTPPLLAVAAAQTSTGGYAGPGASVGVAPRVNTYPLLQSGGQAALGSLFPTGNGGGVGLFGPGGAS